MTFFYLLATALLSLNVGAAVGIYVGYQWRELDNRRRRWLRKRRAKKTIKVLLQRAKVRA